MKYVNLFLLLLVFSVNAFADIPPINRKTKPTPKPQSVEVRMNIRFSKEAKTPTLTVPKSALKDLRAQLEELDEATDAANADARGNFSRTQTVVSGLFLSLGMIFGGVWFARSRKSASPAKKKIAARLMLFFVAASTATVVFANVGPPQALRSINSSLFDKTVFRGAWRRASGDVRLEVSAEDDEIDLVIPDAEGKILSNEE